MLSVMSFSYQDKTVQELQGQYLGSLEKRREYIFDNYIETVFVRKGKKKNSYDKPTTVKRLEWLGWQMHKEQRSDLLIEELSVNYLPSTSKQRYRTIATSFLGILVFVSFFSFFYF